MGNYRFHCAPRQSGIIGNTHGGSTVKEFVEELQVFALDVRPIPQKTITDKRARKDNARATCEKWKLCSLSEGGQL
jgi:hypothetical protein